MKYYSCDNCKAEIKAPEVVLKGVTGTSGGILLPEHFHKKHFCTPVCFWQWVDKYHPEAVTQSAGIVDDVTCEVYRDGKLLKEGK